MIKPAIEKPPAIPRPKDPEKPGGGGGGGGLPVIEYFYSGWTNYVYPSMTSGVTWNQRNPYNRFVSERGNAEVKAGCVPVAVAQFCACWEYPNSFKGYTFDWNLMKENSSALPETPAAEMISYFMYLLGTDDMLSVSYGPKSSSANSKKIPKVIKALGFTEWGGRNGYDDAAVNKELIDGYPLIVNGFTDQTNILGAKIPSGGHSWLVDRVMERTKYKELRKNGIYVSTTTETEYLVYCNWGWANIKDGYYYHKVFNTNAKPSITRADKDGYYNYELRTYIGMRR